jgi:predicted RNase H-related nuclease YkuK (DUF458 family)
MIRTTFRKFNGEKVLDVENYVKEYYESNKNIDVMVGTDSQSKGSKTIFSTIIAMYDHGDGGHGHGAHCIFSRWKVNRYRKEQKTERLLKEVEVSLEIAEALRSSGIPIKYVDIDINPKPKAGTSSDVYAAAYGWVTGAGFDCRYKTLGPLITTLADWVVKR